MARLKRLCVHHLRCSTNSSCNCASWLGGPPNPSAPSRRNRHQISKSPSVGSWMVIGVGALAAGGGEARSWAAGVASERAGRRAVGGSRSNCRLRGSVTAGRGYRAQRRTVRRERIRGSLGYLRASEKPDKVKWALRVIAYMVACTQITHRILTQPCNVVHSSRESPCRTSA
jgi:hypothetical protein